MHVIEHPCVPFSTPIFEGLKHDSKIHIHGHSFHGPQENFCVELFCGSDIAMHLNVSFGCDPHIRLNSRVNGMWQCEDRHHNPVCIDEHFHLKIKNHHHHFEIKINGHHICKFEHRLPSHCINLFGIQGDISVHKIHFEDFHHHNHGGHYNAGYPTPPYYPSNYPPPVGYGAPVVILEEGHHHHHHGLMHDLFHHHGHHHHHHHH
jgi:hypothetical protein